MPKIAFQRLNLVRVCSTALLLAFGAAACAVDATGTTAESADKAPASTTTESTAKGLEPKVDSKVAEPSPSTESAGWFCTAAACNAGCESCGGSGGYCKAAYIDGEEIQVCGCHRPCI